MNKTGFAILTPAQLYMLYGPDSPYNNTDALERLLPLNASDVHAGIEADVHTFAASKNFSVRQKDIVLSPILTTWITLAPSLVSQPVVLSPIVLSPV